jgi:hypothetical protein
VVPNVYLLWGLLIKTAVALGSLMFGVLLLSGIDEVKEKIGDYSYEAYDEELRIISYFSLAVYRISICRRLMIKVKCKDVNCQLSSLLQSQEKVVFPN